MLILEAEHVLDGFEVSGLNGPRLFLDFVLFLDRTCKKYSHGVFLSLAEFYTIPIIKA